MRTRIKINSKYIDAELKESLNELKYHSRESHDYFEESASKSIIFMVFLGLFALQWEIAILWLYGAFSILTGLIYGYHSRKANSTEMKIVHMLRDKNIPVEREGKIYVAK